MAGGGQLVLSKKGGTAGEGLSSLEKGWEAFVVPWLPALPLLDYR